MFKITQPNWPEYTWILNDFFFVNLALQTEQWYGLIPGWSFIKCSSILIVVGKSIWHIGHVKRVVFTSFFTPNWLIIWFSLNFLNSESKFLRSDSKCLGKGSYIAWSIEKFRSCKSDMAKIMAAHLESLFPLEKYVSFLHINRQDLLFATTICGRGPIRDLKL